ncbi:putative ribonuclease H-like domain-containing protein [Tanacetum coccineum]
MLLAVPNRSSQEFSWHGIDDKRDLRQHQDNDLAKDEDKGRFYKKTGTAKNGWNKCIVALIREMSNVSIATNTGHFARVVHVYGSKEGSSRKQEAALNAIMPNQIFEKDEKLKKYRRIGMKAVKDKDDLQKIVDSWFASSKNLWKLIDCGMSSQLFKWFWIMAYNQCAEGHRILRKEISRGFFALRETDFPLLLTGPSDDSDAWMAREAVLRSKRVVHADVRKNATTAWNNTTSWQLKLRWVVLDLILASKMLMSGSVHVIMQSPKKCKMGTVVKTSAGPLSLLCLGNVIPLSIPNSGPTTDSYVHVSRGIINKDMELRGIFDSGSSGTLLVNRALIEDYQELSQEWDLLLFELGHFNLFSISQICDKKLNVLFTDKECFVVSSDFKMPDENQVLLKVPRQHNMYTFDMKNVDSSKGYTCLLAKASSDEAKLWHRRLEKHGYRRGTIDKTLFIKKDKKDIILVQIYVDDIIFGSTKKSWSDEFEALMKGRFQMSAMGELTFFLGLQVKQSQEGIFISQDKYVAEILKKFDFVSVKSAVTPMETKAPLAQDEGGPDVDLHLYRSMIGCLMYLTASRPDIMYAVCACSRFQVTPKVSHLYAVKRIFKYIKGKPKLGLWYPRESPLDLVAYSDSDYAAANLDRKSTTGGCQFLGRRLISWQCKKQTIVATSTTEAEYVAAASCCGQVLWLQNQLLDYGFNFMNTIIHIDNQSTICIIKNPVYHSKTKHIEIRHHFIRDCYEKKLIQVQKIHTDLNVADLLTKAFDGPRYYLRWKDVASQLDMKRTCPLSHANLDAD